MRLRLADDVTWEGVPVPGERTHALLRALADAGTRGASDDLLIEELWPDEPPAHPAKALQVVVSRARAATCPEAIERTERGYRLGLAADQVDLWAFRPEGLRLALEGRYAEALPLLEQAPQDDAVVAALIRSVADVHGVPAALERYESYRHALADRLGVDPSPELQALHRELLARDNPVRAGVRFDLDALIGRDADVAALQALVRSRRLVSIVGPGGLGKTRLAHLLARSAEQPVVHFVELVSVTSDDGVAVEVADVLGARESVVRRPPSSARRSDPVGRIVDLVGGSPTLLVLDNCEQVVEGVAELVAAILARTPDLTVVTTTRIPLGLAAERVYLLPELSVDDAVSLFAERASAARPGVVLDQDRIRSLVARLDGLPLAVELAAAKVRVMSVAEIERRLENRFTLLQGGSRDAPERHQTLLAVIDWSWNLLTEPERIALRRLSVFRDGFALPGADAVIGGDALVVVSSLVEQSLVVVREDPESGEARYRLLETVREFSRMQLVDAGDDETTGRALRAWAVALTTDASRRLFSGEQVEVMRAVRVEEGNLVEVLRQSIADQDASSVAALLGCLTGFWSVEGSHLKMLNLGVPAQALLASGEVSPEWSDDARAALAGALFTVLIFTRSVDRAAVEKLRELGGGRPESRVRAMVTVLLTLLDAYASGTDAQIDRVEELAGSPDAHVAQWAAMWASQNRENFGDIAGAIEMAERALALVDDDEGPWGRALIEAHLSGLCLQVGDRPAARLHAERAAGVMAVLGAFDDWAQCRATVALAAIVQGDLVEAETILAELAGDDRVQSVFGGAISQLCGRAELLLAQQRIDEGLRAYRDGVASLVSRGMPGVEVWPGAEPWVLLPGAAALAAHCRHGAHDLIVDLRADLCSRVADALAGDGGMLDHPLIGTVFYALAVWELTRGDRSLGARAYGYARAFGFNRMLPSLDAEWAESMIAAAGQDVVLPERDELHEGALTLLAQLA